MPSFTKVANGNVKPSRIVKYDTSVDGKVLVTSAASDPPLGISGKDVRRFPGDLGLDDGYHAIAGENCLVHGTPGEPVLLVLGGTVTRGDALTADSDGRGVTTTSSGDWVICTAEFSGTVNQAIPVRLKSPAKY